MAITYRTTGAWGVGTGFDLPAATIDANFWDLHGRIVILEAWPTPAAIESFTIDGNQMTVVMDDATTHGPYTLPTYVPSAFEWAPDMDVVPGQMFSQGATIYTVVYPHTTVDPFDAGENDGGGNDYYQEFITVDGVLPTGGAAGQSLVKSSGADYAVTWEDVSLSSLVQQNSKSANYTLTLDDVGFHIFHPSADTTGRTFTIPANASVAVPIGGTFSFVNQDGAGVITIAITTDTMRLAGAGTTGSRTLAANGIATALKVTATEWIISGTGLT